MINLSSNSVCFASCHARGNVSWILWKAFWKWRQNLKGDSTNPQSIKLRWKNWPFYCQLSHFATTRGFLFVQRPILAQHLRPVDGCYALYSQLAQRAAFSVFFCSSFNAKMPENYHYQKISKSLQQQLFWCFSGQLVASALCFCHNWCSCGVICIVYIYLYICILQMIMHAAVFNHIRRKWWVL